MQSAEALRKQTIKHNPLYNTIQKQLESAIQAAVNAGEWGCSLVVDLGDDEPATRNHIEDLQVALEPYLNSLEEDYDLTAYLSESSQLSLGMREKPGNSTRLSSRKSRPVRYDISSRTSLPAETKRSNWQTDTLLSPTAPSSCSE